MSDKEMMSKRPALGKGFDSLLGGIASDRGFDEGETSTPLERSDRSSAVLKLRVHDIEPNPHQPRKVFDDEALLSLSASIKEDGVVQPIIVSKNTGKVGKYVLVAGERRWRASKLAGLEYIPALIKEGSDDSMLRIALIENIQRADLTAIEEAEAYQSLIHDFGLSQEQCAKKVAKDRSTITNALRLLSLPREVQDDLLERRLSMGHGRALVSLEDKKLILRARDIVVKKELNVRQTEMLCKRFKKLGAEDVDGNSRSPEESQPDLEYLADALRGHLRTKVRLLGNPARGRIEVSYFSAAELERIVQVLGIQLS